MPTPPATLDAQLAKLDSLKLAGMISQDEYNRCKLGLLQPYESAPTSLFHTDPTQHGDHTDMNPTPAPAPAPPVYKTPTPAPALSDNGLGQCSTHGTRRKWSDLIHCGIGPDNNATYVCSPLSECPPVPMGGAGVATHIGDSAEAVGTASTAIGMQTGISQLNSANMAVTQAGDWFCQCGEFNPSSNTHCMKCGAPTEAGTMATPGIPVPITVPKPGPQWPMMPMAMPMAPMPMPGMMGWGGRFFPYGALARGRGGLKDFSKSIKAQPLGPDTTEEMMRAAFESFGPIESVALKLDGTPAYGYVNFINAESVASAMAARVVQIGMHRAHITCKTGFGQDFGFRGRGGFYAVRGRGVGFGRRGRW